MAKMTTHMPGGATNAFAVTGMPVGAASKASPPRQSGKAPKDSDRSVNSRGANPRPDHILGPGGVARPLSDTSVTPSRVDRPVGKNMRTSPGRDMSGNGHMGGWADSEHPTK